MLRNVAVECEDSDKHTSTIQTMPTAAEIIHMLDLQPLPLEGGFFRETYRSPLKTAIYYLLTPKTFSALHKLPSDEIYHFYLGDPVEMLQLHPDGTGSTNILGTDVIRGMQPQLLVPGETWQGSRLVTGGKFALLGTTMAPPFKFEYYQAGNRKSLTKTFPKFEKHIKLLTREY